MYPVPGRGRCGDYHAAKAGSDERLVLADQAREVRERAHAPYSKFKVGAAVQTFCPADHGSQCYARCSNKTCRDGYQCAAMTREGVAARRSARNSFRLFFGVASALDASLGFARLS